MSLYYTIFVYIFQKNCRQLGTFVIMIFQNLRIQVIKFFFFCQGGYRSFSSVG